MSVSVVIPTLGRDQILIDTVARVLGLERPPDELLVVDQSPGHEPTAEEALRRWADEGAIRWLRLSRASIPHAMNVGLEESRCDLVLFLDDDVEPAEGLVEAHVRVHLEREVGAVVGMILQPGEEPRDVPNLQTSEGLGRDLDFCFASTQAREVHNCMAGNLSVRREAALAAGGFDEAFVGVAYRFETEFCRRLWRTGYATLYDPRPCLRHLKAPTGGTRTWGSHLTSMRPEHSVGAYYFFLREGAGWEVPSSIVGRLVREVSTRFHARRPWWIVPKLVGEIRAVLWARELASEGPRLLKAGTEGWR